MIRRGATALASGRPDAGATRAGGGSGGRRHHQAAVAACLHRRLRRRPRRRSKAHAQPDQRLECAAVSATTNGAHMPPVP